MNKRPTIHDPAVIKVAATKLLDDVLTWLNDGGDTTDFNEDEEAKKDTLEQIEQAIVSAISDDGYAIAKELDGDGWDPDTRLVEILDHTSGYLREEVRRMSAVWFEEQGLERIPNDTKVKSKQRGDTKGKIGTVTDFHKDGRYTVNFPELGHVKPGTPGVNGTILDHENLEKVL